jgi:hypothetical protein
MSIKKRVLISTLGVCLLSGSIGVYAGTIIERYKTPRGNIATVEKENVHKNRIGITVNGEPIKTQTWYSNSVTYAPLREVATMLGASVNYNSETMSADIVTKSDLLDLLGLKIGVPYYIDVDVNNGEKHTFELKSFNPVSSEFKAIYTYHDGKSVETQGKISENKIRFKIFSTEYELVYHGGTKQFRGEYWQGSEMIMHLD